LLATARPEFTPPWPAYAHARVLPLTRLSRREAAALATRVAGHKALPAELMAQILARTDGVPLFVEELTKTVLESGMVEEGVAEYVLAGPLRPLTIPTTLHASLMARLDRLAPAREIAQIGAAIGREFSYALLRLVAPIGEASMAAALEQLVGAELLFRRGEPPDAVYTFKHALVQDAAYDTLLRHRRHDLHGRIATVLEQHFPDIVSQQPEILARHSAEAGLMAQAVAYWARAGQRSLARSAMVEAAAQWRKGLELLATLPDDAPRQERELELQIGLGTALTATEGYAAAVTGATYRRARELCQALGRTEPLIAVLYGEWTHHIHRDELDRAHELAGEARRIAEARQDPSIRLMACRISGVTSFFRGALAECRAFQEEGLALFDPAQRPAYTGVADPRVISLAFLARALLLMGHVDRAQARIEEALAEAAQLSHAYTQSWALWQACFVDWMVRPVPVLLRRTEALIALSVDQHFRYSHAVGILFRGWCMSAEGRHEDSLVLLRQGLAEYRATGTVGYRAFFQTLLADACGKARQWEAGLAELVEAATLVETTNERWVEAEIHRVRGDLLVGAGHAGDAEASFHRAIKVAARQEAKLWQLRATVSLCRLLRNEGRHSQAGALLGSIYSEFEEGRATPPLLEAAALLAEFD
jgi:predicted ATPase